MSKTIVSIRDLSKQFGAVQALSDISLDIQQGEIFALLGPSGCGKSTLLRIISGFESPTSGELLLDGEDMTPLAPNKRPINMVFQSYAVFPHMSVQQNVEYGLKMEKVPTAEIEDRVQAALAQVHLTDFAQRKPEQLSGGQRQRVALARALVKRPRVLLLDEPLSALDAKLRDAMRLELVKLQESVGITFIIVTHDQAEAMAMADRIAVLESGRLRQVATPAELYAKPVDAFVADFIGNMNTFSVQSANGDELLVDHLGIIQWQAASSHSANEQPANSDVLAVRPEHVKVTADQSDVTGISVRGVLGDIAFQGQHSIAEIRLPDNTSISAIIDNAIAATFPDSSAQLNVWAHWEIQHMLLLPHQTHNT